MTKLAIIGASSGQVPVLLKAKELGIYTICFAWEEGAIGRDIPNKFYPISIFDYDKIIEICKNEHITGIVSNASEKTAVSVSYISTALGLSGISYNTLNNIKNKGYVRDITNNIAGLTPISVYTKNEFLSIKDKDYPYIIKPIHGGGKKGVQFINDDPEITNAIKYAIEAADKEGVMIEKCIRGHEISVETLSYHGNHYVIQITDKINSGPPHFVELEHHQPSLLPVKMKSKIKTVTETILNKLNVNNCACHIEFKIDGENIYLIEVNPRGGGDEISNTLIYLSTGFDFLKAIIDIAIDEFNPEDIIDEELSSGIYFLCDQSKRILPYFKNNSNDTFDWMVRKEITNPELREGTSNYDRNGFLIYKSDKRILL